MRNYKAMSDLNYAASRFPLFAETLFAKARGTAPRGVTARPASCT
jgi:hypothetical protein